MSSNWADRMKHSECMRNARLVRCSEIRHPDIRTEPQTYCAFHYHFASKFWPGFIFENLFSDISIKLLFTNLSDDILLLVCLVDVVVPRLDDLTRHSDQRSNWANPNHKITLVIMIYSENVRWFTCATCSKCVPKDTKIQRRCKTESETLAPWAIAVLWTLWGRVELASEAISEPP